MTQEEARQVARTVGTVLETVLEAIRDAGENGVPGGTLYAALMTTGMTLATFEKVMSIMVQSKRVRKSGHVYYWVSA